EIYLEPFRLEAGSAFSGKFCDSLLGMDNKSIHIGSSDSAFLLGGGHVYEKFENLYRLARSLEIRDIVVHAHHLKDRRDEIMRLFDKTLPGMRILVENNGFDNAWGADVDSLEGIFDYFNDDRYRFCLDVCHVWDWRLHVQDFINSETLRNRLTQVHYSYSTFHGTIAEAQKALFDGEKPFHALWSYIGKEPGPEIPGTVFDYPLVLEGCIPNNDRYLDYLKEEIALLGR
ncbi:MAG: hypothetical protein GY765_37405, partial [bacterium]|nr:hypothetical protein [bacterium]